MPEMNDMALIREYADRDSESAFADLVHCHVNLVYSVAFRYVGNSPDAQDVTQAVFVILAKKAGSLRQRATLTGWLYETTRFTCGALLRTKGRQRAREQEAYMESTLDDSEPNAVWRQLAPILEEAMNRLNEKERTLLALRFFDNKTAAEAAALLGIREGAAHKRAARALEKLRRFFVKRGIDSTAATIAGAISANSVQAAPAGLEKTVSAVAAAKGAASSTSTLTLIKGALKLMAWTKAKTVIVVGVAAILTVGTTSIVFLKNPAPFIDLVVFSRTKELTSDVEAQYASYAGSTPEQAARTFFEACGREDWAEVAKFWEPGTRYPLNDEAKNYLGGLQVINLGKPFSAWTRGGGKFGGAFVPYKIQFKNGEVKRFHLQVRCDNPDKRWYVDGGL